MTVFMNNLQRLFKRKGLIFILLFPIVFTAFYLMGSTDLEYRVGILDEDQTFVSQWLIEDINAKSTIRTLQKQDDLAQLILLNDLDFIIHIPKGYQAALMAHEAVRVETYYSKGNSIAVLPKSSLDSRVDQVKTLAEIAADDIALKDMLTQYSTGLVSSKKTVLGQSNSTQMITATGMGILVMSMMLASHASGAKMSDDKDNGIYQRIMASPLSKKRYSLESMASLFVMIVFNVVAVMAVIGLVLGGDFGPNPLNVLLVLLTFGLVAVALTTLINSISKDRRQAATINAMVTTPLCMLGGCFWPISITPKVMQYVSNFVPTKWVMDGVSKTIAGASLADVSYEIMILLLFALAIFILSSSKRIAWSK